jgi:hypothetical protein
VTTPAENPEPRDLATALRDCDGFAVHGPSRRVGVVEDVLLAQDAGRAAALAVAGGLLGRRTLIVPVEAVAAVDWRTRRVLLYEDAG